MPRRRKRVEIDKVEPVEVVKEEPIEVVETELIKEEIFEAPTTEASEGEPETPQPTEEETKGPAQFTITTSKDKFTREGANVSLTIATLSPRLKLGESITIKRVN